MEELSENERLTLLTAQLNFLSSNINAFFINYLWLKDDKNAYELNKLMSDTNIKLDGIVDDLILKMDAMELLDDTQMSILKPIHDAF